MLITDAQAHIWPSESPQRPWIEGGRSFAHGDQFSADELRAAMRGAGVDRVVLVPPSFEGDRNDVCLAAAAAEPERFAVMGRISLSDPASPDLLRGWLKQPGMLGVRLSFSQGPSVSWMTDGTVDWLWPIAESAGIPVMVFSPGLLRELGDVAVAHPNLRLVVDHLGISTKQRDDEVDPVIDDLVRLAPLDNVAVKASCLASNVTDDYPFPSLHDRIRRVVDAFSPRRVFWGSDVTRLRCTYDELRRLFTDELDFLSAEDLEWIMGRGVSEWLNWPADGVRS